MEEERIRRVDDTMIEMVISEIPRNEDDEKTIDGTIQCAKHGKSPGPDNIMVELIEAHRKKIVPVISEMQKHGT